MLAAYPVTVNPSDTSLSPTPAAITVGHDQTFTLNTNLPDNPGIWIAVNSRGDTGAVTLPPDQNCLGDGWHGTGVKGGTVTLRGCQAGQVTLSLYRRGSKALLDAYAVTVNPTDTSLSPIPSTITAGQDQTFTVNTGVPNDPGLYITATLSGDAGRVAANPSSTQGCWQTSSGALAVNGSTFTLRGCEAGTATITLYRANSSNHLVTYRVTVNPSQTSLSPTPGTFTIGTNQTFTLTTDIANDPGVWVGLNYAGDSGRLVLSSQNCALGSVGTAAVSGNTITLKPCAAGTVTIKINRSNSGVTLKTYTVTINSS